MLWFLIRFFIPKWVMGLNWYDMNTINTAIIPKLDKFKTSALFKSMGYVVETLYNRSKTDRINLFEVPLHTVSDSNDQGVDSMGQLVGTHGEILTKGWDSMIMTGDMAMLSTDEYGEQGPADKFIDLVMLRRNSKQDGIAEGIRKSMWRRVVCVPTSKLGYMRMNGFFDMYYTNTAITASAGRSALPIGAAGTTFHNINSLIYPIWQPYVWDATTFGGTPGTRAGIASDPDSPTFILNMIDLVVTYLESRKVKPSEGCVSVGASLFSIIGSVIQKQDHRVPDGKYAAKLGYTSINYKEYDIVRDDGMSENQADNTDGWIAGISLKDLDLTFATADKISAGPYRQPTNAVYFEAQILSKRQFVAHALNTSCFIINVFNQKGYIPAFTG